MVGIPTTALSSSQDRILQSFLFNFFAVLCLGLRCMPSNYIKVIFGFDNLLFPISLEVCVSQALCQKLDTFLNTIKVSIFPFIS